MRTTISVITLLALTAATPAFADQASKQETLGVGTGAVVGALAGGPIGFIVGAAIGAKLGDTLHQKNTRIDTLSGSLEQSEIKVVELERNMLGLNRDIDTLDAELEQLRDVARPELVSLLQAGIAMDLLFRTDESVLADTTGDRLATLAGGLATMPEIHIKLDGFADERGEEDYNLRLSQKRVEFVRDQLIAAGIHPSRISGSAHGEAPAQDATPDSFALERRVSLTLSIDDSPSFAATPK